MSDATMPLRTRIEKAPDAELLREMIGFAAQRLMELEVAELTGASHGGRSAGRLAQHSSLPRTSIRGLPRAGLADPRRHGRAGRSALRLDPEAQEGRLLPGLSGGSPDGREGARRHDPSSARRHRRGSLHPWRLDPLGQPAGQGHGDDGHLEACPRAGTVLPAPQRGRHRPPRRRPAARAIRRVGGPARPLHDAGSHAILGDEAAVGPPAIGPKPDPPRRCRQSRQGRPTSPAPPGTAATNASHTTSRGGILDGARPCCGGRSRPGRAAPAPAARQAPSHRPPGATGAAGRR